MHEDNRAGTMHEDNRAGTMHEDNRAGTMHEDKYVLLLPAIQKRHNSVLFV